MGDWLNWGKKRGIESRTPAHHSVLCSLGILSTRAGLRITTKQYTPSDEPGCNTTARQDRMILEASVVARGSGKAIGEPQFSRPGDYRSRRFTLRLGFHYGPMNFHPAAIPPQGRVRSGAPSLRFFYARVGYLKARPANLPHTHLPIIKLTWRTLSIGMPTMTKSHTELSSLKPIPPRRTQRPHVTPPQAKKKRTSAYPPSPPEARFSKR